MSGFLPVVSGVPQGSILGPLLFLVFVNDIPSLISSAQVLLFADDVKCSNVISSSADCTLLQQDLNAILDWCSTFHLTLNKEKCLVVRYHINNSPFDFDYHLSGHTTAEKSAYKDLGIFTTYNLKWKSHYKHITSRAYKMLGLLRRVFNEVAYVSSKRLLYISLVRSQLLYCSPLWRPYLISDIGQLQSVQRRATRYISKCSSHNYKERLTDKPSTSHYDLRNK